MLTACPIFCEFKLLCNVVKLNYKLSFDNNNDRFMYVDCDNFILKYYQCVKICHNVLTTPLELYEIIPWGYHLACRLSNSRNWYLQINHKNSSHKLQT